MKKVFHFDAPREKYHCDAAILWCFDNRFELGFRKFLKRIGVVNSDPLRSPAAPSAWLPRSTSRTASLCWNRSVNRCDCTGTRRVILMVHSDCGAYGGLAGGFGGDTRAEAAHHQRELVRAAANLLEAIPGIEVQGYFVDFEGIWDAELTSSRPLEERPAA